MKNKKIKLIINIGILIIFIMGLFITSSILYLNYKGKEREKALIKEYENSLNINDNTSDSLREEKKNTNKGNIWGLLEIKKINLLSPIVEGVSEENLKYSIAHFENSSLPDEEGNCVLGAHNNVYGSIFENLKELEVGDIIELNYKNKIYKYKIFTKKVIEPTDFTLLEKGEGKEITLVTCTNRAKNRLVVKGILIE
ncbi:class D sortase [Clostridium sp. LIBA-8841]|uniref:class D sortase n=1 Tax=Clostridium sp. LIBA-8841 TaxID=2987530 RepID=UPI002AC47643|nr:class D sortase [Clostridium sp. LIBA-8841]MDZ5252277.1 class D sortase [Clostridium sp. LIBA-8841]